MIVSINKWKRLLFPLLAALALPTAVNAESYWLIIHMSKGGGYNALEKIEVSSFEACEKQGRRWENSPKKGSSLYK